MFLKRTIIVLSAAAAAVAVTATSASAVDDTRDGAMYGVYCDGDKYGMVGWNDYADADHGDDIDNVIVLDEPWDGMSIEVIVRNSSNDRTVTRHAYSGERLSIDVGNVVGGEYVEVTTNRWNNGKLNCHGGTWSFYE